MNDEELDLVNDIEEKLKHRKNLTEFDKGQLDVINKLRQSKMSKFHSTLNAVGLIILGLGVFIIAFQYVFLGMIR